MPPIGSTTSTYVPTSYTSNFTGATGGNTGVNGPLGGYYNQGAGAVGQVANGFSQYVQGGNDLMGNPSQGQSISSSGAGSPGTGAAASASAPTSAPASASSPSSSTESPSAGSTDGADSTGWKKLRSINDDDGSEGGEAASE